MRSGGNVSIRVVRLVHAVGQPRGGALLGLAKDEVLMRYNANEL